MDEICEALAAKIYAASKGGYSIFYEDELFDEMPSSADKNRETLEAALKRLTNGGFIEIKYARGNAFCMAGIKPYEIAKPSEGTQNVREYAPINLRQVMLYSSLGALLGGLFGGVISVLITSVFV